MLKEENGSLYLTLPERNEEEQMRAQVLLDKRSEKVKKVKKWETNESLGIANGTKTPKWMQKEESGSIYLALEERNEQDKRNQENMS